MAPMPKTINGYCSFEVVSAIQKCIRRGLEREAMLWCLEMANSSRNFYSMMLNRLFTIAHEDIGLANPAAVLFAVDTIRSLFATVAKEGWADQKWRKHGGGMRLGSVVRILARSDKSREADHFMWVLLHQWQTAGPGAIPDYALDKHTRRGKKQGRDIEHFLEVGTLLDRPAEDRYRDEAYALRRSQLDAECEPEEPSQDDKPHDLLF